MIERLRTGGWWGQIVGPHGSGKSTLLVALIPELERAGRQPLLVTLHQGEHRMPRLEAALTAATQVVVDGYEQLSWWAKRWLQLRCRVAGCGLLITAHADAGLPSIYQTLVDAQLARWVVARLTQDFPHQVSDSEVAAALARSQGNLREALFTLYDVYQQRQSTLGPTEK